MLIYIFIKKVFKLLINENKLKGLIRQVINEMALKHGGIHPVSGILNPEMDITAAESGKIRRNRFPSNAPEKFEQKLKWILGNYPGCTIHSCMFPSNFDMHRFILNHIDAGTDQSPLESSTISDIITATDQGIDRVMDITDRVDDIIHELSQEFDVNDPTVQKLFNVLQESNQLVSDEKNGVLIYFGAHTNDMADPPTPYNIMHQLAETGIFNEDEDFFQLTDILSQCTAFDGTNGFDDYGFFEGRAQSRSRMQQSSYNLIFQSAGWLNPDIRLNKYGKEIIDKTTGESKRGHIMSKNETNPDSLGSSNPYDITKRCLAPKYKNDRNLIKKMVSLGFVETLIRLIEKFWNIFRGRVILTFSMEPL